MGSKPADIRIEVANRYLQHQSDPEGAAYVHAYVITIHNDGPVAVQLLRRYWLITHGSGRIEEVEGEGVVGEQPWIAPGSFHRYTSGCVMDDDVGTMEGHYSFQDEQGERFMVDIPRFVLSIPRTVH